MIIRIKMPMSEDSITNYLTTECLKPSMGTHWCKLWRERKRNGFNGSVIRSLGIFPSLQSLPQFIPDGASNKAPHVMEISCHDMYCFVWSSIWGKLWRESYHGAIGSISFEVEWDSVEMWNTRVVVIPFFPASLASFVPTLIASSKSFSCSFTNGLMTRW